jgi:hypothetical protein
MSEGDRPSLFLVDSDIPAYTPRRHTVQATLDLSETIALLPVCLRDTGYLKQYLQFSSYFTGSTLRLYKVKLSP